MAASPPRPAQKPKTRPRKRPKPRPAARPVRYRVPMRSRDTAGALRDLQRVQRDFRSTAQGLVRTGQALGLNVQGLQALRGLSGFHRAVTGFGRAIAPIAGVHSGIGTAMTIALTALEVIITVIQAKAVLSAALTAAGWAKAGAGVAAWGPLFFIPLLAIGLGLGIVASAAAAWDVTTARSLDEATPVRGFGSGFRGGTTYRPRTQIDRELRISQDNDSSIRTEQVWEDVLAR